MIDVLSVRCPYCRARPGWSCLTSSGRYAQSSHALRRFLTHNSNETEPAELKDAVVTRVNDGDIVTITSDHLAPDAGRQLADWFASHGKQVLVVILQPGSTLEVTPNETEITPGITRAEDERYVIELAKLVARVNLLAPEGTQALCDLRTAVAFLEAHG